VYPLKHSQDPESSLQRPRLEHSIASVVPFEILKSAFPVRDDPYAEPAQLVICSPIEIAVM
jgi:hypothetical protein